MYLLIFYTNVYGLKPEVAAVMFLIVRIVDVLWDPLVGAFVDKHNPKLGKYRSYLIWGGTPLTGFAPNHRNRILYVEAKRVYRNLSLHWSLLYSP